MKTSIASVPMSTSTSSMLLTNNGKIRKRISKACNYCRQRKIKCDGNLTKCRNCFNHSIECTYSKSARKKKVVKVVAKTINKMSLTELQKKVEQMDDHLTDLNKKVSQILNILILNNLKGCHKDLIESEDFFDSESEDEDSGEEEEEEDEESDVSSIDSEAQLIAPKLIEQILESKPPQLPTQSANSQLDLESTNYSDFSPMSTTCPSIEDPSFNQKSSILTQMASPASTVFSSGHSTKQRHSILSPYSDSSIATSNKNASFSSSIESSVELNKYDYTLNNITRIDEQLTILNDGIDQLYKSDQVSSLGCYPLFMEFTDPFGNNVIQ